MAGSPEENMAAEQLLLEAVRADPDYAGAYAMAMVLGARLFMRRAGVRGLIRPPLAQHAVRLDTASRQVGAGRFQRSRYREAASAALRVWERQPTHRGVLNNLGIHRHVPRQPPEWGLGHCPGWAVPRTLVGLALMELGRTDDGAPS